MYTGQVTVGPIEGGHQALLDRIGAARKDDRYRFGCRLRCVRCGRGKGADEGHLASNQLSRQRWEAIVLTIRVTIYEPDVLAFDKASFFKPALKGRLQVRRGT